MPALQPNRPSKRQLLALGGGIVIVLVLILLVFFYPLLQMKLAEQLMEAGKYSQAEPILSSLTANKSFRLRAGYKLVACQLFQGKSREAAHTVISLTGAQEVDDLELAILFADVAAYLIDSGNGEAALELAKRVRSQNDGEMLVVAVKEISFLIAKRSGLPLALEAVNFGLAQGESNWRTNLKAFNLLLTKSLESSPLSGEPALDRALELYPGNITAITRKASILGDKFGPRVALDFLATKEPEIEESITPEYLSIKRTLLLRLAVTDPKAELSLYTDKMPSEMLVEIALQGLNHAASHTASGRQYYNLAPDTPQVAYRFARNLFQMREWEAAREIFTYLERLDPAYLDFQAAYAALNSKTKTVTETFAAGETVDALQISPDGQWLAWRKWKELPQEEIMVSSLVLTNLATKRPRTLGDATLFKWSPNSRYLAYQTITGAGLGHIHIYNIISGDVHSLPLEYDIIDFNWAGADLMVQAQLQRKTVLLRCTAPDWEIEATKAWQLNSGVNQDYAWLTIQGNNLLVYRDQNQLNTFSFENQLMFFSDWSPNGNLAIIEDMLGRGWVYNHNRKSITPISTPGQFAGWGQEQDIFWFLPLWSQVQVLVRLDSSGNIKEYYPYSFDNLYLDISISASGNRVAFNDDERILLIKK